MNTTTFEGYKISEILSAGFCFNRRRLDVYNRYCVELAKAYNAQMEAQTKTA